ncbi:MAG: glycosyltransferase family 39 protein [Nitrospinae bacterium]|nr:glycosyltransferase family 39 protein [Nitrospinota bacterium]
MSQDPEASSKSLFSSPAISAVLVYVLMLGYLYSFSRYGFNIWDEGAFAYGCLRTYLGQISIKDFYGYPPGQYLYGALFYKLFGIDVQSLRIGVILYTPAMVLMVYGTARRLMSDRFAALAALFMLSAPSMYYSRYFTFFCVSNLFCLVELLEKRRALQFFMLIGSIMLSFYFKVEVALFSAAVSGVALVLLLVRERVPGKPLQEKAPGADSWIYSLASRPSSRILVFIASAGTALSLVYFVKNDILERFIDIVFGIHQVWGNPFPQILPLVELFETLGPHEMFERLLFYAPILVYALTGVLLLARTLDRTRKNGKADLYLLTTALFGVCAFGLVVWRAGFDNLLRTLPPFYILLTYFLCLAHEKLLGRPDGPRKKPAVFWTRKLVAKALVLVLPLIFFYEMNVKHGFYAGTVGAVNIETERLTLDRIDVYTNPSEAKWIRRVVELIQAHTRPGDPVLALPLNAGFNFLSGRPNPIFYDWILPGMLDEKEENKLVEQLQRDLPKIIVYVDIAIDGKDERRLINYAPQLTGFIAGRYRALETVGFFNVLVPIEPALKNDGPEEPLTGQF